MRSNIARTAARSGAPGVGVEETLGADEATGFIVGGTRDAVKSPDPVLTAQQRSDTEYNAINSYVMLHVNYRLNLFGTKDARQGMHNGPGFGPGDRRGGRYGGGGGFGGGRPRGGFGGPMDD